MSKMYKRDNMSNRGTEKEDEMLASHISISLIGNEGNGLGKDHENSLPQTKSELYTCLILDIRKSTSSNAPISEILP